MIYPIAKGHYHDFSVLERGKLPPRAYGIPFSTRARADAAGLLDRRYRSDKVQCLSGVWDFCFYPWPADLPQAFDTAAASFRPIEVPGCWQFQGYDKPFYVNTRYQFPFDPPHIPQDEPVGEVGFWGGIDTDPGWHTVRPKDQYNFVGVYRKRLTLQRVASRMILSFLGVASCLDLYCNGVFVGYSEGSHNVAEFDLAPLLQVGENELLVVVRRWCSGSYLECQDMFRNNGIFRDVLLYALDNTDLYDIRVDTRPADGGFVLTAACDPQVPTRLTLSGHGLCQKLRAEDARFRLHVPHPKTWSAETPALYDLYFETDTCCVKLRVGFKDVAIQGRVLTLNGMPVKLRGVNHHDTHPSAGWTMTPRELERDVLLLKRFHANTVRTSHYPPDPLFLELCDHYGLYVVDEADLETHGTMSNQKTPSYNTLTEDESWQPRYLDRVRRLFCRDRNHPSVLMWSLGNESGGQKNTDAMYAWLKAHTDLPIHYESAIYSPRRAYDVASQMYPPVSEVAQAAKGCHRWSQMNDRPYFLCEYAHAMGVGPGGLEDYWRLIYAHDCLLGGCIWEMADHAVLEPDGGYTYGGDHGEWEHDGNFCVDGLFYPDRSPSTGARLMAQAYRPLRFESLGEGRFRVFNTRSFTPASAWRVTALVRGSETPLRLSAGGLAQETFCLNTRGASEVTFRVERAGYETIFEQIALSAPELPAPEPADSFPTGFRVEAGRPVLTRGGAELRGAEEFTLLYRAPMDNDTDLDRSNPIAPFLRQKEELVSVEQDPRQIRVMQKITCPGFAFSCVDVYTPCQAGVLVTSTLQCLEGEGLLPRFAKVFRLEPGFAKVRWYGRDRESYRDMYEHSRICENEARLEDMMEPNLRPQESGSRMDTCWAELSDGRTAFRFEAIDAPFELGVKPCTDRALLHMRHRADLVTEGAYAAISLFQMGVGSASCGPHTDARHTFPANRTYTLRFVIR